MSENQNEIEKLRNFKQKLDHVSPSFCLAKWLQLTLHLQNGQTHSCHHPVTHTVPLDELKKNPSALHNTAFKKKQRSKMLAGQRPEECHYCWRVEDAPGSPLSDRTLKSVQNWAAPYLQTVALSPADIDINPKYLEISFGHECQFKCSYCAPHISSAIMKEFKKYGRYPTGDDGYDLDWLEEEDLLPLPEENNPYVVAFWQWWPELYPELEVFRITGGEPLINQNTFRVLEYILTNPHPKLQLAINSNLGVPQVRLEQFVTQVSPILKNQCVKDFILFTSVDGFGKQAEYIRNGMSFNQFINNINFLFANIRDLKITIMTTFNALSLPSYKQFLQFFLKMRSLYGKTSKGEEKLILDISYLHFPSYQSVQILPKSWAPKLQELSTFMSENLFLPQEIERMKRIESMFLVEVEQSWLKQSRQRFVAFFREHDRRRGTDFMEAFPEFQDLFLHWENHAYSDIQI